MSREKRKAVHLPAGLYDKIKETVKATEFGSVDEYIISVLNEVLKEEGKEENSVFSKEDEEQVKSRLRALGYLD